MDTRIRIQEKARDMFMRLGIRSVSMDDIAAALGMSKKTIYQSFADKDELVDSVIGDFIDQAEAEALGFSRKAANAVEEIFLTMRMVEQQFRNLNPIVMHDLQKFHLRACGRIDEHKDKFVLQLIRDNIERGKSEGLYRPEADTEVMSRFRLESMMVLFNMDLFPPSRFNLADVSLEVLEHFLYGLSTPEGRELIRTYKSNIEKGNRQHG
jgi:AcrR family transcriptional regulator